MTNSPQRKLALLAALSLISLSSLSEDNYDCPDKVSVKSTIIDTPKEWITFQTKENTEIYHYLVSSIFTDGPPSDKAFLRPTNVIETSPGNETLEYDLSYSSELGSWLVCQYGDTPAMIWKKLPSNHSTCKVRVTKDLSKQRVTCE